jgi:hypothetical protein
VFSTADSHAAGGDLPTPEAKVGMRSSWTCAQGLWSLREDGSRCIREGVRKDDPDLRSSESQ